MAFSSNFRQPMPSNSGLGYPGSLAPPPLPPRNYGTTTANSYGGYSAPGYSGYGSNYGLSSYGIGGGGFGSYGGYGNGGFGSYGGYGGGGFGGYGGSYGGGGGGGYGYGGMGGINSSENSFIQMAENSARPAFDSFRSVMGMLQSVTMMFDSTFHAIHASYASVLGVADNFSRLRSMFARVFSAFSAIKALNWLYRRLLRLVGLQRDDPSLGAAWASALNENLAGGSAQGTPHSNWPAVALMALLIAGPYLIMKIVSQMVPQNPTEVWNPMEAAGTRAETLFDFNAGAAQELTVRRGQLIMVAPKLYQPSTPGWVLACDQSKRIGLVPANYIKIENAANLKSIIPRNEAATNASVPGSLAPTLTNILPQASLGSSIQTPQQSSCSANPNTNLAENNTFPTDVSNCPAATSLVTDVTPALAANAEVHIPSLSVSQDTSAASNKQQVLA